MVKHFDLASFELFQILNCTVRTPVSSCGKLNELLIPTQTPPQTPTSGGSPGSRSGKDSDSRSGKENESRSGKENDREIDCISNLDKDKMMAHILDCLSALKRVDELHHDDDKEKTQLAAVKGRVFRKAIDLIMRPKSADRRNPDLEIILQSFPDGTKLQDDRKWLSLHWAVLEDANIDQDDIEILYSADPMALTRHHLKHITDILPQGYTPAHLISFQKHPTMPLVRFLDIHSPRAFLFPSRGLTERRSRYPVQIAAAFTESIDFLQLLLQLQPGAPKLGLGSNSTPLCELIKVGVNLVFRQFFAYSQLSIDTLGPFNLLLLSLTVFLFNFSLFYFLICRGKITISSPFPCF